MTIEQVSLAQFAWMNEPSIVECGKDGLEFVTMPDTDFWQRTHYGFRRNTGHAFLTRLWSDFSFTVNCEFFYETLFDQAGIILYLNEENWAKASLEYGDGHPGLLGSVVTANGWSDWASTPQPTEINRMFYRLSRRGADFLFECSDDGEAFRQMRIFHLPGDLSAARVGVYACSPKNSSFKARFTELTVGPSKWDAE